MRTYSLAFALVALMLSLGIRLEASESFTLETHVYVYRNSDFLAVKIPGATATDETHGVVFRSPAIAQFDQEKLSLDGPRFVWSGGHNPPDRFSLIATPTVPLTSGKPVTLSSTAPVQYLEKLANGTLQANPVGFEYNPQLQTIDIGGRDMARLIRGARYTEYPGADHFIWDRVYADPALWDWLFSIPADSNSLQMFRRSRLAKR